MMKEENKYIEAVGRRKTSVARVRITEAGKNSMTINDREAADYFPTQELQIIAKDPLQTSKVVAKFKISAVIAGGGIHSQAEALRHGISRALVLYDSLLRKKLKQASFLMRDPRAKERRKFGLKKARKAPQWSKR
jgi:small subunit ribosomal protein S9